MAILPFNLSDLDGSNGFVINGINTDDNSGSSVSSAGDFNGDGLDDLLISAPEANPNGNIFAGESYVVFGSSEGFAAEFDLAALDGSNGFVINGINEFDILGRSVSSAGDFNDDGFDDLLIGAPLADPNGNRNAGESYVVFGSSEGFTAEFDLAALDGSNGFAINGIDPNDASGRSISSAGDFNGDGFDDLIIGNARADSNGNIDAGESYVIFGSSEGFTAEFDLAALDGNNGFVINGIDPNDASGSSVSSAGDFNGDGFDDLLISSLYFDEGYYSYYTDGESYVVFGSSEGFTTEFDLAALDGSNGFVINSSDIGDALGVSISSAGDFNSDGFDDLIIGDAGEIYVVFGSSEGFTAEFDLAALDGSNGFVINGSDNDDSGFSVSSAGDFNGDGFDDLLIGAPSADPNGNRNAGESYVLFGSSGGFSASLDLGNPDSGNGFVFLGIDSFDISGISVSSAGDFNGDGADDLIIGAPGADPNNSSSAGENYVVFGIPSLELIGTSEDDLLTGGTGEDSLSGLGGDDTLRGEAGNDQINGGTGNDLIIAGSGNDTVEGEAGSDQINGNTGNDRLSGKGGSDNLFGGDGNDFLSGGTGNDRLLGQSGNDTLKGDAGRDTLEGGGGNDSLSGGNENDRLLGQSGNDTLKGDAGLDTVLGGDGNDSLSGGSQADTLTGGLANDLLKGEAGNDRLIGVEITAPAANLGAGELDTLTGGLGRDIFVLGDEMRVYYSDGKPSTTGESDFARITDFDPSQDVIQLQGTAQLYNLDFFTSGAGTIDARLIFDPGVAATEELIAILPDVAPELRISAPAFTFV